jgi:hypothetical protein
MGVVAVVGGIWEIVFFLAFQADGDWPSQPTQGEEAVSIRLRRVIISGKTEQQHWFMQDVKTPSSTVSPAASAVSIAACHFAASSSCS